MKGGERHFWKGLSECLWSFDGTDYVCLLGELNKMIDNRRMNRTG